MLEITGSTDLKGVEMETIWQMLETCIIPIITYAGEAVETNKKEMKKWNQILDDILKRILILPVTTPREILYLETGLLDRTYNNKKQNKPNIKNRRKRHRSRKRNIK